MDIITHTLSGVATGTVVMSFSPKGYKAKLGILSISGFGAALPDLDAISLWSRFDNLFGRVIEDKEVLRIGISPPPVVIVVSQS